MQSKANAVWKGGLKKGEGKVSGDSGAFENLPYSFATRFEGNKGTDPEEMIAAAHASCFAMALSMILGEEELTADEIRVEATTSLEQDDEGFAIKSVHLSVRAAIPNASNEQFQNAAQAAKAGCPISKLFKADISMEASLD